MQIVGREVIDAACKKHAQWRASLHAWIRIVSGVQWKHFADVRLTLKSADQVGRHVIFNIAQNKARLISIINYQAQRVVVEEVIDHATYNREDFTK
ncbi:MAG: type II toxin-antitoxin system HigB family toxin [Candidatus Acidiferrales bacterium]